MAYYMAFCMAYHMRIIINIIWHIALKIGCYTFFFLLAGRLGDIPAADLLQQVREIEARQKRREARIQRLYLVMLR
jgi:hypothetical protein